jgi:hypothetical protein
MIFFLISSKTPSPPSSMSFNLLLKIPSFNKVSSAVQTHSINPMNQILWHVRFIIRLIPTADIALFSHRPVMVDDNSQLTFLLWYNVRYSIIKEPYLENRDTLKLSWWNSRNFLYNIFMKLFQKLQIVRIHFFSHYAPEIKGVFKLAIA